MSMLVSIIVLCGGVAVIATLYQVWRRRGRGWTPAMPVFALATATLLLLAAADVRLPDPVTTQRRHLTVVLDVSASAKRDPGQFAATLQAAAERLAPLARTAQPEDSGGIVLIADGAVTLQRPISLAHLPAALQGMNSESGPAEGHSDLAQGLRAGLAQLRGAAVAGSMLLVSDGLATRGDAEAAAAEAGRLGVPVHVLPVPSPAPGIGLIAAYLPAQLVSGSTAGLRLVLANPQDHAASFTIRARRNGTGATVEQPAELAAQTVATAVLPVEVSGRGLQFVDVELVPRQGEARQRQRLYTLVVAPTRLAVLGPAPWLAGLPRDSFQITAVPDGTAFDPAEMDAVIIDGVPAERLAAGQANRLLQAARRDGMGLLLVNGAQRDSDEAPTVLMGYEASPLDPLLPVSSKPRQQMVEPPGRTVAIVIDTSGSMCGRRLMLAKLLAVHIIDQLRPRDRLTVAAFSSSATTLLQNHPTDAAGKSLAQGKIGGLACGGGTNPSQALGLSGQDCGMFFISDGEFDQTTRQPGCLTTVFAVEQTQGSLSPAIRQLGEVHLLNSEADIGGLRLGFFQPPKRNKTFEKGRYRPDVLAPQERLMPDPAEELDGNAVSFLRDRAELAAVRPYPVDPVLAFQEDNGTTGVVTTEVPAHWGRGAGAQAVRAWVDRLVAWSSRDRYIFSMAAGEDTQTVLVSLAAHDGRAPSIDSLSVSLRSAAGDVALRSEADGRVPGRFRIHLPETVSGSGVLVLREIGADALPRPQQIPIHLAPSLPSSGGSGSEHWDYGLNAALLKRLTAVSGGTYDLSGEQLAAGRPGRPPPTAALWPWFLAAAALSYLALVAIGRFQR